MSCTSQRLDRQADTVEEDFVLQAEDVIIIIVVIF